jgi:hypothetical protein
MPKVSGCFAHLSKIVEAVLDMRFWRKHVSPVMTVGVGGVNETFQRTETYANRVLLLYQRYVIVNVEE